MTLWILKRKLNTVEGQQNNSSSEEKGSLLCKCSILLGFFMSKKQERLRSELLSEDEITNLLGFLTYSRVQKSWNELFFKILKKPSIVQKKTIPHMKAKLILIGKKTKKNCSWKPQKPKGWSIRPKPKFFTIRPLVLS